MRAARQVVPLAAVVVLLAACATGGPLLSAETRDGVVSFSWRAYGSPESDGDVLYDLRVWTAEQGVARSEALRSEGIDGTSWRSPAPLAPGEYVWTVRARWRSGDALCVSPWYGDARTSLVPPRGYAPLRVK